jgi:hypothetical protein
MEVVVLCVCPVFVVCEAALMNTEHEVDKRDTNVTFCRTCGYLAGKSPKARAESFCVGDVRDPGKEIFDAEVS